MSASRSDTFDKITAQYKNIITECLTQHLPVNIFLVDKAGHVCWANDRLLNLVGMPLESVKGLHISQWDHARWECVYEVIVNRTTTTREETYDNHYFFTIRQPLFDEAEEVIGVLGVSIEITERKKAEIAKEQFLQNIRHDIRTPVSGIVGLSAILKDAIQEPELIGLLDSLVNTSESLLSLLDRVFDSIQIATGEISMLTHRFSLYDILESVYKLHQAKAVEKQIEVNFYYDAHLPKMMVGEAMRVQRVVWELLTNALKYTDQGSISLKAKLFKQIANQLIVEIQVRDTGVGIPLDKREFIFAKFTRLTSAWAGHAPGQGLGLFNIKQLIQDLKGTITLESVVNKGSVFTCHLPFKVSAPVMSQIGIVEYPTE